MELLQLSGSHTNQNNPFPVTQQTPGIEIENSI